MEFFIRQGATDPLLKMRMVEDGKNDKSSFNDVLESSDITFEMSDIKTGEHIILGAPCNVTTRTKLYNNTTDEYYITYKFTEDDTAVVGRYEGRITITGQDLKLIVPIKEKLIINII